MSAALRNMGPQFRRLGISVRNFSSSVGGGNKEVRLEGARTIGLFSGGLTLGTIIDLWFQKKKYGRVIHFLGIPIAKKE
ncbi:hypothetical protein MKX03_028108 [Papaver bracteatum]|nr:hypothetical protein MKX03_028108 [Papaver bracteatum]